jgi:multidrug efflux pump subunit AcrA (membrane-fusion protein)
MFAFALPWHAATSQSEAPVPVRVVAPRAATLGEELRLTGTLTAERSARVSPRVDGLVARMRVDAGDAVRAGDPLVELDATLATLALRRAEAEVAEARASLAEHEAAHTQLEQTEALLGQVQRVGAVRERLLTRDRRASELAVCERDLAFVSGELPLIVTQLEELAAKLDHHEQQLARARERLVALVRPSTRGERALPRPRNTP